MDPKDDEEDENHRLGRREPVGVTEEQEEESNITRMPPVVASATPCEEFSIPTAVPVSVMAVPTFIPGSYISVETAEPLPSHVSNAMASAGVGGMGPTGGDPHHWPSHICDLCAAGPGVCCIGVFMPIAQFGLNHLSLFMAMNASEDVPCTYQVCICCGASFNYTLLLALTAVCIVPCYAIPHYHFRKKLRTIFHVYGYTCLPIPPCCDEDIDPSPIRHYASNCWRCCCHSSNCDCCIVTFLPCCAMIQEARLIQLTRQVHVGGPAPTNATATFATPGNNDQQHMLYAR